MIQKDMTYYFLERDFASAKRADQLAFPQPLIDAELVKHCSTKIKDVRT
jgi:hypothetical protein